MTPQPGLLTAALRRIRPSALLPLIGGNLLVFLAALLGLHIPDSHTWQLLLSLLLALGLISGLLLWNASGIRRMRTVASQTPLWTGALLLGACLLIAALLFHIAGYAEPNIETRAGYWNSQLSSGMRHLLSYERLVSLQQLALAAFRWVFVPTLVLPFAMEWATFGLHRITIRRASRVVLSAPHWVTAVVALGITLWVVPWLTAWHPTHSVGGEMVSAVLRLGLAGLLVTAAAVLLLAVDAELLHRKDPATLGGGGVNR
ncbi:hypothetical protein [Terriglobus sp.]|uniref:hypothetical protein n=1 Tax=Terriglobus sp. TaxID=1889013 RepID=UPI003B00A54A